MSRKFSPETALSITDWLARPDYTAGLRLYHGLHGEDVLYRMLVLSQNSFNQKKLTDALRAALEEINAQTAARLAGEPEAISELRKKAGALMDERTGLKAQLRVLDGSAQRLPKAQRILAISAELTRIFAQIEFYHTNQTLWEPDTEGKTDDEIQQEYLNLRTYISRARRRYETAVLPQDKADAEKKLKGLEARKAAMELLEPVQRRFGTTAGAPKASN